MKIPSMFDSIARRYDLANHVISLGMHLFWKKKALRESRNFLKREEISILDLACGTGDLLKFAEEIFPKAKEKVGLDPSGEMLQRAVRRGLKAHFIRGAAEYLPFKDNSFDLITVSFGVRNFENRGKAFEEIFRVLKPDGIFTVLEFAKPDNGDLFQNLSWCYTKRVVPTLGGIISGSKEPYEYLAQSIERFPLPKNLTEEVERKGFKTLKVERLFPPITVLYIFKKLTG